MPQVIRVSLVVMSFASTVRRRQTPIPFMEMRAFLFLDRLPTPVEEAIIKRSLKLAIEDDIMHQFLPHIFESGRQDQTFSFISRQTAKKIGLLNAMTRHFKVEIEGFEVEPVDLDEIFHEPIYWSDEPIGRQIDHYLFHSTRTIPRIMKGTAKLHLKTGIIYHYVAFYDENGDIDGEYDDLEISQHIKQRMLVLKQRQALYGRAMGLATEIEQKTGQLSGMISEIERLNERYTRSPI
jgi:hypothetical protein